MIRKQISLVLVPFAAAAVLLLWGNGLAQDAPVKQKAFMDPEVAVRAMIDACVSNDVKALVAQFGIDSKDLVEAFDDEGARQRREGFAALAKQSHELKKDGASRLILLVGDDKWPFPVPLLKGPDGWRWDAATGKEELRDRIVGENEYQAISLCRGYVDAQIEYAGKDRDGDEVREYAQRLKSTPGSRDGLYWKATGDELLSPLGPLVIDIRESAGEKPQPLWGYYFKIIKKQGANVPGGKYDYVINGHMIAGFALIAAPAKYGVSGVMTFVVNHQGKVFEKDLGEKTLETAKAIDEFNPDDSWNLVEEEG